MIDFVYILYSTKSDKYYVGYSRDVKARVILHNTSIINTYTSKHRPWELVCAFAATNKSEALRCERFIKK